MGGGLDGNPHDQGPHIDTHDLGRRPVNCCPGELCVKLKQRAVMLRLCSGQRPSCPPTHEQSATGDMGRTRSLPSPETRGKAEVQGLKYRQLVAS